MTFRSNERNGVMTFVLVPLPTSFATFQSPKVRLDARFEIQDTNGPVSLTEGDHAFSCGCSPYGSRANPESCSSIRACSVVSVGRIGTRIRGCTG